MHRRLRELDRLDHVGRPAAHGDTWRRLLVAATTSTVVAAAAIAVLDRDWGVTLAPLGATHRIPRGRAPAAVGPGGSFRFMAHQVGRPDVPVSYDPCRPIHVYVNQDIAPLGSGDLLQEAVHTVAQDTGLRIVVAGGSHDLPTSTGVTATMGATTAGAQPVLVAWTTDQQVTALQGNVVGLGGSSRVVDQATMLGHYLSGTISLDTPALTRMLTESGGRARVRAVIMHELGHVVGLAHVDDSGELMYADNVGQTSFGPGDLRGLSALGRGHCFG